eukprot:UN04267
MALGTVLITNFEDGVVGNPLKCCLCALAICAPSNKTCRKKCHTFLSSAHPDGKIVCTVFLLNSKPGVCSLRK